MLLDAWLATWGIGCDSVGAGWPGLVMRKMAEVLDMCLQCKIIRSMVELVGKKCWP